MSELEGRIATQLLQAIGDIGTQDLPVRLSRIAGNFLVDPKPRFDPTVKHGRLEYNPNLKAFIITLGSRDWGYKSSPDDLFRTGIQNRDPILTRRLRFTYAHELAHRFCFVNDSGKWVRAMELAVSRKRKSAELNDLNRLTSNEEQLCNNVANRVLVPDLLLANCFQPVLLGSPNELLGNFFNKLKTMAELFAVTDDCLAVACQKAIERRVIRMPPKFCALLVGNSSKKTHNKQGAKKLRVLFSLLPDNVNGLSVKPIFPGMAADNLGSSFTKFISGLLAESAARRGWGEIPIQLLINTDLTNQKADLQLNSCWELKGSQRLGEDRSIFIWGFLDSK
jgi:hypothetical protein